MNQLDNNNAFPSHTVADLPKESFDVKAFILRYLGFWPYFVISVLLSLTAAYFINRYAVPRYYISATLLVKDARSTSGASEFLEGAQLLRTSRNLENEMGIMRSYSMAAAAVKQLDFGISYFKDGNIRTSEIYGNSPIRVEADSTHRQLFGVLFDVMLINDQQFTIKVVDQSSWYTDLLAKIGLANKAAPPFKEGMYTFGQYLEGEHYRFRIQPSPNFQGNNSSIQFRMNDPRGIAWSYAGRVFVRVNTKGSSILILSMETTVPNKDVVYLNQFIETYIRTGLEEKNLIAKNTIIFINEQLNGVSDSLDSVEERLQQFQIANQAVNLSESGNVVFNRLTKLEEEKAIQEIKSRYYENLIAYVNRTKDFKDVMAPSVLGIEDNLTTTLLSQLIALYTKRNALVFSAKDQNLYIAEIDSQIQSLTQQLLENIRNVIRLNQSLMEDNRRRIRIAEGEISKLPRKERDLVNIKRKFSLNENLYVYLLQKRAEAGIAQASSVPDSRVIDSAVASAAIYPDTSANNRNAFLIGLLLPGIIIFLIGYLNDTITSREQLETLTNVPILGVVTHSNKPTSLVVTNNPKSAVSETFRSLRSNLKYLASDQDHKCLLITSGISGEGKTFCAINLASVMALSERKTILIGVDLRKPRIFDDFGFTNETGLSTYLIGRAQKNDIIQKTKSPFLDVITAGPVAPNPTELIMNGLFDGLLEELKKEYQYIVLDSPPLGLVADSFELIRHSDVVLYVVRQRYTKRKSIHTISDLYNKGAVKNVSLILNDFMAQAGYGYGYDYGYGYGYYEDDKVKQPFWKKILSPSFLSGRKG